MRASSRTARMSNIASSFRLCAFLTALPAGIKQMGSGLPAAVQPACCSAGLLFSLPTFSPGPAHVQPDGGAARAGPQLHQVAHLVDQPESMPGLGRGPAPAPGQRIGDPALILHLAEDLGPGVPDA